MDEEAPPPTFFVARDRARRFARYIGEALQERRLNYRGAEVGMASLIDEADEALAAVLEDLRATIADVLAGRIRDRERGMLEIPLVVMAEGLLERVALARRMDQARTQGGLPRREAGAAVVALLDDALLRIDAYCGTYDEKRPLGRAKATDLGHALSQVERQVGWARMLTDPQAAPGPIVDRIPPDITSEPNGLEDVLRAARALVPAAPGPWRVELAGADRPLQLSLGEATAEAVEVQPSERLARALDVLGFVRPIEIRCAGRPASGGAGLLSGEGAAEDEVEQLTIVIADEAAGRVEASMAAAAGAQANLLPEHEKAVRTLLGSPALPAEGPPPAARLVAIMGVLKALDEVLHDRVLARAKRSTAMVAARGLPRESTRKAPLVRNLTVTLEQAFPQLPMNRVEEIASATAHSKLASRHVDAGGAAVLLALLGRSWSAGGRNLGNALKLDPLSSADVEALVRELCALGAVRRDLEAGRDVSTARLTQLEQAVLAVLGRLGQVPPVD